jgi:hypothetical protein
VKVFCTFPADLAVLKDVDPPRRTQEDAERHGAATGRRLRHGTCGSRGQHETRNSREHRSGSEPHRERF